MKDVNSEVPDAADRHIHARRRYGLRIGLGHCDAVARLRSGSCSRRTPIIALVDRADRGPAGVQEGGFFCEKGLRRFSKNK